MRTGLGCNLRENRPWGATFVTTGFEIADFVTTGFGGENRLWESRLRDNRL